MRTITRLALPLLALATISLQAGCGSSRSGSAQVPEQAGQEPSEPTHEVPSAPEDAEVPLAVLLSSIPDLSTFSRLVEAVGMESLVGSNEMVTLLAPNDAAFAELPKSMIDNLVKPASKGGLLAVLQNHVLVGAISSEQLQAMNESPPNALGLTLEIASTPEGTTVSGARIVQKDLAGTDGIVHVVDEVLLP